jgi:hypothetical protein
MALGQLTCSSGYIPVDDAVYSGNRHIHWKYSRDELVVINDINSYKEAFANSTDSMPYGYIDFTVKSLVGVNIYIDAGNDLRHQGCFCYNPDTKKWKFKIEYTLRDQCDGSKIYSGSMMCCIICPKLPVDAQVFVDSRNINPL